ncbi:uncharacterized protein LOC133745004 [Rosa rugosa]|uniref:uncharacterized protein LOC133745004 n=1 Tax=Rosa rugosa TaxID=74645 RepID=UPI002B416DAE|nr:uncharacterized protein LOC133745004 [Rosa rugosa]
MTKNPIATDSLPKAVHGCILELLNKKLENQKWVSRRGNVLSSFTTKAASLEDIKKDVLIRYIDFSSQVSFLLLEQVRFKAADAGDWKLWKYVDEAQFGPGPPINSVFVREKLVNADQNLQETCKWMSVESCLSWLQEVKPRCERVGPLIVVGLPNEFAQTRELQIPSTLPYQEYPPGVVLVPMASRTGKPFRTTNLVVFAPKNVPNDSEKNGFIACGDALIVDLGCQSKFHEEVWHVSLLCCAWKMVYF